MQNPSLSLIATSVKISRSRIFFRQISFDISIDMLSAIFAPWNEKPKTIYNDFCITSCRMAFNKYLAFLVFDISEIDQALLHILCTIIDISFCENVVHVYDTLCVDNHGSSVVEHSPRMWEIGVWSPVETGDLSH